MTIALIGEAWGEQEARERKPFVGPTGGMLNYMLRDAGIERRDCFLSNVFNLRPYANKIETLCGPKELGIKGYPSLGKGGYVKAEYANHLERLGDELERFNPNIIVALGNTAMWALLGTTAITKNRGVTQLSTHTISGFKVLPTYHPAAVAREYSYRPVVIADLIKARKQSTSPLIIRPTRKIWIEPTLGDIIEFNKTYIKSCKRLAVDIETFGASITCIGFAPKEDLALVIPFLDSRRTDRAYWPTTSDESKVWRVIKDVLQSSVYKVFQNGLYDIAFLYRGYGIKVNNAEHDTMLLHHALQPERLKGFRFLGSVYTDEGNWKQMRLKHTIKRDD
jgi:uracil-DNA glycosylase